MRLDLTEIHHLLPEVTIGKVPLKVDSRQKFLIMDLEDGNRLPTIHSRAVVGMYGTILCEEIEIFIEKGRQYRSDN